MMQQNHTKMKLCGLSRPEDIAAANEIQPDYIGFIFWEKSRRCVTIDMAAALKQKLSPNIKAVGVFVDADVEMVAQLLQKGIIDAAQLHGSEDKTYIQALRELVPGATIIQAFQIKAESDVALAVQSEANYILLDNGTGTGEAFDWNLLADISRPYFLAGGLTPQTVFDAIQALHPYGVDVSSGIETQKVKDKGKMLAFAAAVRAADNTE